MRNVVLAVFAGLIMISFATLATPVGVAQDNIGPQPTAISTTPAIAVIENINTQVGQTISIGENGIASVTVQSAQAIVVNFEEALPVKSISVSTSAAVEAVTVNAQALVQKPTAVPEPTTAVSGVVVSHYLEITVSATPSPPQAAISVQVASAVVQFKVQKSWLTTNNIDPATVKLMKYNGAWVELLTAATGAEDATYKYYSATTTGFSTFAVTGKRAEQAEALNLMLIIGISAAAAVVALSALYVVFAKRGR
jgi:PGF-pre-PGF domain-containing protein